MRIPSDIPRTLLPLVTGKDEACFSPILLEIGSSFELIHLKNTNANELAMEGEVVDNNTALFGLN